MDIGMSMLDGDSDRFLKKNGIFQMQTNQTPFPGPGSIAFGRAGEGNGLVGHAVLSGGKAPGGAEIILGSRSSQGETFLPVNEDHIVPFTEPRISREGIDVINGECATHIMTPPLRFQQQIIVLTVQIVQSRDLFQTFRRRVLQRRLKRRWSGVLTSPLSVKSEGVRGQIRVKFGVHVVVEMGYRLLPLILNRDPSLLAKGIGKNNSWRPDFSARARLQSPYSVIATNNSTP